MWKGKMTNSAGTASVIKERMLLLKCIGYLRLQFTVFIRIKILKYSHLAASWFILLKWPFDTLESFRLACFSQETVYLIAIIFRIASTKVTSKNSNSSTRPSLKAIAASLTDFLIASNVRPPSMRRPCVFSHLQVYQNSKCKYFREKNL